MKKNRMSDEIFHTALDGRSYTIFGRVDMYRTEEEFQEAAIKYGITELGFEGEIRELKKDTIRINPMTLVEQEVEGYSYWVVFPTKKGRGAWESWWAEVR